MHNYLVINNSLEYHNYCTFVVYYIGTCKYVSAKYTYILDKVHIWHIMYVRRKYYSKYILIHLYYLGCRTLPVFPIFCTLFCQLEMEIVGLILHFLLLNSNLEWHTFYLTFWIPTFLTKIWFSRNFTRFFKILKDF